MRERSELCTRVMRGRDVAAYTNTGLNTGTRGAVNHQEIHPEFLRTLDLFNSKIRAVQLYLTAGTGAKGCPWLTRQPVLPEQLVHG